MHPIIAALGRLDPARRAALVRSMAEPERLCENFDYWAHPGQLPPPGGFQRLRPN